MPLPILFIGLIAAGGTAGMAKSAQAVGNSMEAGQIGKSAEQLIDSSNTYAQSQREECKASLNALGSIKINVLNHSVKDFIDTYSQIKNINFKDSEGLEELNKFHIDQKEFGELQHIDNVAIDFVKGGIAGTAGGALTALGAYNAAQFVATASTGTAISALSGAAASNATLAFFGGGSLATGGLGMAGGAAILGGFVAAPALLVMGCMADAGARKNLEQAKMKMDQAQVIAEQLNTVGDQCSAIRRRCYQFYRLMARLDAKFVPQVDLMMRILKEEGDDFRNYKPESKKAILAACATVKSIKAILDTPILTPEGNLTEDSGTTAEILEEKTAEIPA